jgi:head-tail adaptor
VDTDDTDDMDVEEFQHRWRQARQAWDRINQLRLEREAAGTRLSEAEHAGWLRAKSDFEACEQLWDKMYRAGVVVVVGGDEDEDYSAG